MYMGNTDRESWAIDIFILKMAKKIKKGNHTGATSETPAVPCELFSYTRGITLFS